MPPVKTPIPDTVFDSILKGESCPHCNLKLEKSNQVRQGHEDDTQSVFSQMTVYVCRNHSPKRVYNIAVMMEDKQEA